MPSASLDELKRRFESPSVPDMIFPDSVLSIRHLGTGRELRFDPVEALAQVDWSHSPPVLVANSQTWRAQAQQVVAGPAITTDPVHPPYDWTFSTRYRGTCYSTSTSSDNNTSNSSTSISNSETTTGASKPSLSSQSFSRPTSARIDLGRLRNPEPILFYGSQVLFEDELGDRGMSQLSAKVRVMPSGIFAVVRHWLRVDRVLSAIAESRVHVDFATNVTIREFQRKQAAWDDLVSAHAKVSDSPLHLRDQHALGELMPSMELIVENILLAGDDIPPASI